MVLKKISYRWRDFIPYVIQSRARVMRANALVLLMSLCLLPLPMFVPFAVEKYATNNEVDSQLSVFFKLLSSSETNILLQITILFFGMFVLRTSVLLMNRLQYSLFVRLTSEIAVNIRKAVFNKIFSMKMADVVQLNGATLTARALYDVDTICEFICSVLGRLTVSVFTIIFSVVILLYINAALGVSIFLIYPVVVVYWTKLARGFTSMKRQEKEAQEAYGVLLSSTFDNMETVRALSSNFYFYEKLLENAAILRKKTEQSQVGSHAAIQNSTFLLNSGIDFFQLVSLAVAVYFNLSVGEILIIYGYLWLVQNPIIDIIYLKDVYYSAKSSLSRINELLDVEHEPKGSVTADSFSDDINIKLKDIYFSYSSEKSIYDGLDFEVKSGDFVSLGGASGSGKSSLVALLVGFHYPNSGKIYYAGKTIEDVGAEVVRKNIVAVLQDTYIFNASLRENLALGKNIGDAELIKALRQCQLGEYYDGLAQGLDTLIGDDYKKMSGGQKQRIAIARTIIADPKVVIFDEATSSLDLQTERRLFSSIMPFLRSRTSIIISHRLETLVLADKQYVLEKGKIRECGSVA